MNNVDQLDFDQWMTLAKQDPDGFETRRREVLERFFAKVPSDKQQRLRSLQWRIDQLRRRSTAPISACYRIYRMMWDSLMGENGLVQAIDQLHQPIAADRPPSPHRRGQVLPFRPRPVGDKRREHWKNGH